jgi:hypothetical protein
MSALGQNQTWRSENAMSALPSKADITGRQADVRFGSQAGIRSAELIVQPEKQAGGRLMLTAAGFLNSVRASS